jgi:ATP-dependent HslUV protease subunit HslV
VGDVLEPDDGVIGIGSGGPYALAAAKGLMSSGADLSADEIVRRSLEIAADIDIYTNDKITLEQIHW